MSAGDHARIVTAAIDDAYRTQSRRVRATLIRLLGSFDAAEEALHDAFTAAVEQWPREGVPTNPTAWLVSTGRFRTIDRWRRQARFQRAIDTLSAQHGIDGGAPPDEPRFEAEIASLPDDELRMIFTCCHPAIPPDARIALTLREFGGLTTEEIARAYLVPTPTIAQRIVRAKAKIRDDAIPYAVPSRTELPARLDGVLQVLYLIFNEGYVATGGLNLTRLDLCAEATRLVRLIVELIDDPEANGLLALMLFHDARAATRVDAAGDIVLLEHQDRSRWDRAMIGEANRLIERTWASRRVGHYALQAAIAAAHANAQRFETTDWTHIVALYELLARATPTPVVALNRAVALAMRDGLEPGLAAIDAALQDGGLEGYALAHSARADVLRRLGRAADAQIAYTRALALAAQAPERRFLQRRLDEVAALLPVHPQRLQDVQ